MTEKENELKGFLELIAAGALGGACSWLASWMEAMPALPQGYNLATLVGSILIGAIIGTVLTTVLIGFGKPSIKKLMAVSCLCGILWLPLCGYLPKVMGKVFAMVDIRKLSNEAMDVASKLEERKDVPASAYDDLSKKMLGLIDSASSVEGEEAKICAENTLKTVIGALTKKSEEQPELVAGALYKIGAKASQYGYMDAAKQVEKALLAIPTFDKSTLGFMYGNYSKEKE